MNNSELEALLKSTCQDAKFTGREQEALRGWVMANIDSDAGRGVARKIAFDIARQSIPESAHDIITWLEAVLKVVNPIQGSRPQTQASEVFFSPGESCLQRIIHRMQQARKAIDICVFTITDDRITRNLLDAFRRGIPMRVITDNEKAYDAGSDIERMTHAGVPIRVDRTPYHMHHKFAIFDQQHLLNGSYNWTRGAAELNEENIVDSSEPTLIQAFQSYFDNLWKQLS